MVRASVLAGLSACCYARVFITLFYRYPFQVFQVFYLHNFRGNSAEFFISMWDFITKEYIEYDTLGGFSLLKKRGPR